MTTSMTDKNPIYKAASPEERALLRIGVPPRYALNSEIKSNSSLREHSPDPAHISTDYPRPHVSGGEDFILSKANQEKTIDNLLGPHMLKAGLASIIGIGSHPTDYPGMVFASLVCRHALTLGIKPLMINSAWGLNEYKRKNKPFPDLAIVHNVRGEDTRMRIGVFRDWIMHFHGDARSDSKTFVIAVVAGTDPMTFQEQSLRFWLDAHLYFRG